MINQGMIIIWFGGVNGLHGRYDPYGRSKPNDWKKGDVLLIDNRLVLHARRSFSGPRRILASISPR